METEKENENMWWYFGILVMIIGFTFYFMAATATYKGQVHKLQGALDGCKTKVQAQENNIQKMYFEVEGLKQRVASSEDQLMECQGEVNTWKGRFENLAENYRVAEQFFALHDIVVGTYMIMKYDYLNNNCAEAKQYAQGLLNVCSKYDGFVARNGDALKSFFESPAYTEMGEELAGDNYSKYKDMTELCDSLRQDAYTVLGSC